MVYDGRKDRGSRPIRSLSQAWLRGQLIFAMEGAKPKVLGENWLGVQIQANVGGSFHEAEGGRMSSEHEIDFSTLTPAEFMRGEDDQETSALRALLEAARTYIRSQNWCPEIAAEYLGLGFGGVLGVFLFRFSRPVQGTDECLWVIEGDLPSAYLVTEQATDPFSALRIYCGLMSDWVEAVRTGKPIETCIPTGVPATKENADLLADRIQFVQQKILPEGSL